MRQYSSFQAITALVKLESDRRRPDEKTLHQLILITIDAIESLHTLVIIWENRKMNDNGNDCLAVVDCVDCNFQQIKIPHKSIPNKTVLNKALYSKKINGPALRYKVATSLLSNHIVWLSGLHLLGETNNL